GSKRKWSGSPATARSGMPASRRSKACSSNSSPVPNPMSARRESEARMNRTTVERKSDREVVVTRTFDAPARLVFEAWTKPELFKQWGVPRSMGMTLRSCELDVRTGGEYRLVFGEDPANPMAFFGRYLDVVPDQRIVWTNEESGADASVTTVTFEEN